MQQEEQLEENGTFFSRKQGDKIEEIKVDILEEFFKTQNMNIEEREPLLNLETKKKNKVNIRISNLALNQTSKDIEPIDTTTLNELTTQRQATSLET